MRLFDHVDGIEGHFCIGRRVRGSEFWEFWNPTGWAGSGKVFSSRDTAEFKLAELMKNGYWRKLSCSMHHKAFNLECSACNGKNAEWVELSATPTKFRKKPVVIEAMLVCSDNLPLVANWCNGYIDADKDLDDAEQYILIKTLEGTMQAKIGDWVIRGVKGEFYPCKDEVFRVSYEPE